MKIEKAEVIEAATRDYLKNLGFTLSKRKQHGETGCDVIAERGSERLFIEIIGFQSAPPIRSREFYECFFRAISRDEARHTDRLVMALPIRFAKGMAQRRQHYGIAWDKIGTAFPNLEIWYVDTKERHIRRRSWNECARDLNQTPSRSSKVRKWKPRNGTIGFLVKQQLERNRSFEEIHSRVLKEFPRSRFNRQHYTWYKNRLKYTR